MRKLLDLFCGAGGAAMGYYRAGFKEIVGIDIKPQRNYPFDFIRGDALNPPVNLSDFDLIHASPPCQKFSRATAFKENRRALMDDLLTPCKEMLQGFPYVIENVPGAPMRVDVMLCGTMFNLDVLRHRWFEISTRQLILTQPCIHCGTVKDGDYFCVVSGGGAGNSTTSYARKVECAAAMEISWMTRKEMTQAVPPAYTEFLGRAILNEVNDAQNILVPKYT